MPFRAKFGSLQFGRAIGTEPPAEDDDILSQDPISANLDIVHGVYSDTALLGPNGPRNVATLRPGELLQTFDHGPQAIASIEAVHFSIFKSTPPPETWPLALPRGSVRGAHYRTLAPKQCLVIESDTAEEIFGDPFIIVPGTALEVLPGIERIRPSRERTLYRIQFDAPQLVLTDQGGVLLFETSSMLDHWDDLTREDDGHLLSYTVLTSDYAREIIRHDLERAGGLEAYIRTNILHGSP